MKHSVRNSIIIFILTILIIVYLLKDNFFDVTGLLVEAKLGFIILAVFVYILYFILDTIPFYNFTREYNKEISFRYMLYLNLVTKFFNGITPLSTGGQPFQVLELRKKDLSGANATNVIVQNYIIFQIALVIWGIVAIVLNKTLNLFEPDPALKQLCIIGYVLNFLILFLLFLVSFSKKINFIIIKKTINLLYKLKIVKHKEKQYEKWDKICDDFYNNSKLLFKKQKLLLSGILFQLLCLTLFYSIPYVLSYSIDCGGDFSLVTSLSAGAYIFLMGCYIPIPGATGGMEYAFLGFYGNYLLGYELNALLLLWRLLTYYLPTIIGGIVFNIGQRKR